jgi:hypothetical protein
VVIKPETGNLEFNASWSGTKITGVDFTCILPQSSGGLYLLDDQGQRYDHIALNGAALMGGCIRFNDGQPIDGTFVFPPDIDGSRTFTFFDAEHQAAISGITLNGAPQSP